jgi:hypothetical protein
MVRLTAEAPLLKPDPSRVCEELMPASMTPTVIPEPCATFQADGILARLKFQGNRHPGLMLVQSDVFRVVDDALHPDDERSTLPGQ